MIKIALVAAMEQEIIPLFEQFATDSLWYEKDEKIFINDTLGISVYGSVLGVGKVNAAYHTAEILLEFSPKLVINVGFAGGMQHGASRGDIVIGDDYRQVDFQGFNMGNEDGIIPKAKPYVIPETFIKILVEKSKELGYPCHVGRITTGDFFLSDSKKKQEIIDKFMPVAFDMESAAVAHVCAEKGVAFVAVRTLSDLADDQAEATIKTSIDNIEQRPVKLVFNTLTRSLACI